MLTDTVGISARASTDTDREETFATAISYPAWVEPGPKMFRDAQGREAIASAVVYVGPTPTVLETAKITLPDGRTRRIQAVQRPRDKQGIHHQEIYV